MSTSLPAPAIWIVTIVVAFIGLVAFHYLSSDWDKGPIPIVETDCGPVLGVLDRDHSVYVFKGIPYAVPPIGERRWQAPQSMSKNGGTCWKGTYQALEFPSECPQLAPDTKQYTGNEDCLQLNIYSPSVDEHSRKPVMVYIHGGYMHFCNASMRGYSPNPWVTRHLDVVFVSVQYRLGALGFLALKELGKTSNYGLLDQIKALQWVQRNIQNFGGDPNLVTVFGHSAGGTFVYRLLSSPLAHGLFHRAWIISGSYHMNTTWEQANNQNRFILSKTGCDNKECLLNLTAEQVTKSVYPEWNYNEEVSLPTKDVYTAALAVIDGYVIPESPENVWEKGSPYLIDVPIILGTTAEETDMDWYVIAGQDDWTEQQLFTYTASRLDTFDRKITEKCIELYPFNGNARLALAHMITDSKSTCGSNVLVEKCSRALQSGVYRYYVTSRPSKPVNAFHLPDPSEYSFHGWDIFAFFEEIPFWMQGVTPSKEDLDFMTILQENIMHFVYHGEPKDEKWLEYPTTAIMSNALTFTDNLKVKECDFWISNGFLNYSWIT